MSVGFSTIGAFGRLDPDAQLLSTPYTHDDVSSKIRQVQGSASP
jgi:hypothetical protein